MWLRILRWGSSGWALTALTVLRGRQGETWPHRRKRRKACGNRAARAWRSREAGQRVGLWAKDSKPRSSGDRNWPGSSLPKSPGPDNMVLSAQWRCSHTYDLWNCQRTRTQFMPPSLGKFATAASGNAYAVLHSALVLSRHTTLTSTGFCRPLL